jgi:ABC-type amino acid transport substrate-binding protein
MKQHVLPLSLLVLCLTGGRADAREDELVLIAPTNLTMPVAHFADGQLDGGMLKELGELIARRMGRRARYVSVPSKRVAQVLGDGTVDGVCYVRPVWISGDFHWSAPLIPDAGLLVARSDAPAITRLADLKAVPVGTVAGYQYARMNKALGADFARDDAPSTEHNVRKLLLGRTRYAIFEKTVLHYLRSLDPAMPVRVDLEFDTFQTQCAFSRLSAIPFARTDRAINSLIKDGSVERMLATFR